MGITCNGTPVATLSDALNNTEQHAVAAVLTNLTSFADKLPTAGSKAGQVLVDSEAIWELITKEIGGLLDTHPIVAKEFKTKLTTLLTRKTE